MQNIIIGTAGHVDHGKTCLIKALSGIDTDRLKEEKKRGITIENGFANLPNDLGLHLGIIDVPGHEKFVKNMLAGIGGIDIVLLVISLEEGIKPQTIEHFEILKSLGIKKGIIVYTKLDSDVKVDFNNLQNQVKELIKGSFLENAKSISVSSYTGENIDLLKNLIFEQVKELGVRNNNKELTRLPIDRVFTMEGFGTVITGTLMEGRIDVGDELMVYPSKKIVKVRQIQSHNKVENSAFAGQRTAINLLNVKKEDLNRGDVLATKDSILVSDLIDCKLLMFKSASRPIKNGERVHFNYGSNQTEATIKLVVANDNVSNNQNLITNNILPMYCQFKFENAIPVKKGDKFIIRFMSPAETCGGGIILNVLSKKCKYNDENTLKHFKNLDTSNEKDIIKEILINSNIEFPTLDFLSKKMNMELLKTIQFINELEHENKICIICSKDNLNMINNINQETNNVLSQNSKYIFVISLDFYNEIKNYINDLLCKFHKDNPLSKGIKKEELKSILFKNYNKSNDNFLDNLIDYLIEKKVIKKLNDLISKYDFNVVIDDKKAKDINAIEKKYLNAGYEPPLTQDVVDDYAKGRAPSFKLEARQILVDLAKEGKLEKLSPEYYIHKTFYDKALEVTLKLFENNEKIQMRDVRDALKTSRKYAILLVDHFDQKRITKTVGDYRILLKK